MMKTLRALRDLMVVKGDSPDWYFAFPPIGMADKDLMEAVEARRPVEFEEVRIFYYNLLPVPDRSGKLAGFHEQSGLRCLPLYDGPAPKLCIVPTMFYRPEGVSALKVAKELVEGAERNEAANRSGLSVPR
jgi:hypothetical protein